jgi:hypothetical protein
MAVLLNRCPDFAEKVEKSERIIAEYRRYQLGNVILLKKSVLLWRRHANAEKRHKTSQIT